jgi:hypothetical protein
MGKMRCPECGGRGISLHSSGKYLECSDCGKNDNGVSVDWLFSSSTYRYRDVEKRREYMREYMRRRRGISHEG